MDMSVLEEDPKVTDDETLLFPFVERLFCILNAEQRKRYRPEIVREHEKKELYVLMQLLRRATKGDIKVEIQDNPDGPIGGSEISRQDRFDIIVIRGKDRETLYKVRDVVDKYMQGFRDDIVFPET